MGVQSSHILDYFFLISTTILIALGSVGVFSMAFLYLGTINALCAIGYKLIQNGKLQIPDHFYLYSLFLIALLIHTWLLKGDYRFLALFLSGGLFWIQTYNFRNLFAKHLTPILVMLGILMGALYFYSLAFPVYLPNLVSLFVAPTSTIKHSDIGDLWAVVLTGLFYILSKKRSLLYAPLILFGGYFLIISYSRAALVSLTIGCVYIFQKSEKRRYLKHILIFLLICASMIFIYAGMSKTILLSRPYYFDAIKGLLKYPLGTGLGSFTLIGSGSNLAHNIILEVMSGMGIFSILFIVWLYKIVKTIFTSKHINLEAAAISLAILTNFCFNTTYTIPAFIWLWFISLGVFI